MEPLEVAKEEGICWECRGVDAASYLNPAVDYIDVSFYTVQWSRGPRSCSLCNRVQGLLQPSSKTIEDDDTNSPSNFMITIDRLRHGVLRLSLQSKQSIHDLCTVLLVPDSFARQVDPQLSDLTIVKSWINDCRSNHPDTCGMRIRTALPSLRVIDCVKRRLRILSPDTPYICLSYVWGNARAEDTSSADCLSILPKTIEDSVSVAIKIGIPFLWVDRYCIDQNNTAEKHNLIQNMDTVYRGAALTIVAVSGSSPHDGLPGIDGTFRRQQQRFKIEPSSPEYTAVFHPRVEAEASRYQTRGW